MSLVLQSIGGGITSTSNDKTEEDTGLHIMVAGLAFQVFSLVLFMVLCAEFVYCVRRCREAKEPRFEELRNTGMFKAFPYGSSTSFPLSSPLFYTDMFPSACYRYHYHFHPLCLPCC
jgi:RTA1 like protein